MNGITNNAANVIESKQTLLISGSSTSFLSRLTSTNTICASLFPEICFVFSWQILSPWERSSPPKTWRQCRLLTGVNNLIITSCQLAWSCTPCWQTMRMVWRRQLRQASLTVCASSTLRLSQQDYQDLPNPRCRVEEHCCTQSRPCASGVLELIFCSWIDYLLWPRGRWTSWCTCHWGLPAAS